MRAPTGAGPARRPRRVTKVFATRTRVSVAGALVLCALAGLALERFRLSSAPLPPPGTTGSGGARRLAPASVAAPAARDAEVLPAALPASLDGTDADGALAVDAAGHLVVDIELRRLFDHFLVASGEEPIATIRARIVAVLRRLPATAAAEAIAILDQYLAYRDAARALEPSGDLAASLDQVHDLRRRMFSPEVARAFFADEEAAIYAAIARRAVLLDTRMSAAERERRLTEIEAGTPAAAREARDAALAPLNAMARETAMRAAGASDRQIAAERTAAFGAEAAARLAELDRTRAAWNARLSRFRSERAALLADPRLDAAERQRRIDELLARSFSPPERIRVEALDRLAGASR